MKHPIVNVAFAAVVDTALVVVDEHFVAVLVFVATADDGAVEMPSLSKSFEHSTMEVQTKEHSPGEISPCELVLGVPLVLYARSSRY